MFHIIWKYLVLNLTFVLFEFYFWLNFELKYSSDKTIATLKNYRVCNSAIRRLADIVNNMSKNHSDVSFIYLRLSSSACRRFFSTKMLIRQNRVWHEMCTLSLKV